MWAERRGGCPACVPARGAAERVSERGANWFWVSERVTGRLGGCATGRGLAAGRGGGAGERGPERGANWCWVNERVTGRLGGCATGRGLAAG